MAFRFARAARALALGVSLAAGAASAAPVSLPLNYAYIDGNATVLFTGSVTIDDSIWTPNQAISGSTNGLLALSLQVSGPPVPGGTTTFTLANVSTWIFTTNAANQITDLNFFGTENASGCFIYGFEVFELGFYCDPEDEEDYVTLMGLTLPLGGVAQNVPALDPPLLALMSLLLAAAALAALRRRR